ncbi:hypothetical protein ACH4K7_33320 [Streptomyces globisporus]|uniref:hypothetical protein n=1 Tax=Streptomyces globisporus TaxID=1908 RepID=UPI00378AE813
MYAIREMVLEDQPAAERLWARRLAWARARGIGSIRTAPLATARTAMPLVLTFEGVVVALAVVTFPPDFDDGQAPDRGLALGLDRLVTDPDVPMPEAAPLSWIFTTRISDVAAREGYDWIRMRVASDRLAEHFQVRLAWQLEATVHHDGSPVHLLRQRAERNDAVQALAPATTRLCPTLRP